MSYNQKESVYAAVTEFLKEQNLPFVDGQKVELSKDQRKTVIEMVSQAALAGEMVMSADAKSKYNTIELMRGYCNGLLSNWLAKDTRLNGGSKHVITSPGSRAGQGDEVIRNLKNLREQLTESDHISAVDAKIQERFNELATAKAPQKKVDLNYIPESIRHLYHQKG